MSKMSYFYEKKENSPYAGDRPPCLRRLEALSPDVQPPNL